MLRTFGNVGIKVPNLNEVIGVPIIYIFNVC